MFDDIDLSQEAIDKFKQGARQYPKLEFTNITDSSGNVVGGSSIIDDSGKTLNELITEHVKLDGISVEFASITGNTFELGTMCAGSVNIELLSDGLDDYYFDRSTVNVSIGVMLDDGSLEYCAFGGYNIDEVKKTKYTIRLTGLDYMMKFNKPCTSSNSTFIFRQGDTVSQAILAICDYCNVEYDSSELINLANGTYEIENIPDDIGSMTCRQVLSQLITLTGCCGRMDARGRLRVVPYTYDDTIISEALRYESEIGEKHVVLTGIRLINANGIAVDAGIAGYMLEIQQNDFVTNGVHDIPRVLWEFMKDDAHEVEYLPYLVTTVSLPYLRPLNKIWITDANGQTHGTIITNYLFRLNNSTKLEAKGIGTVRKSYGKPNDFTRNQSRIIKKATEAIDTTGNKAIRRIEEFNETLLGATALYRTELDGKLYFHNKAILQESKKICTMTSTGTAWTDTGWKGDATEWNYGLDASGRGFFKSLLTGELVVGDANSEYDVTITPDQFAIKNNGATLTSINRGVMTIPRLNIEAHLDFGALRLVPTDEGLDIIYTGKEES